MGSNNLYRNMDKKRFAMNLLKGLICIIASGLLSFSALANQPDDPPSGTEVADTTKTENPQNDVIDKITSSKAEILMIIDKSGSMYSLTDDTIGGFNSMIKKFKDKKFTARVSTVFFNDKVQVIHDRQDLDSIKDITTNEYRASGTTALLDAVGSSLTKLAAYPDLKEAKDTQVIVVIITDGMENSSVEYQKSTIKTMIENHQKEGWKFVFLGADIDAAHEAADMGINPDNAVKYKKTGSGVRANYEAVVDFAEAAMAPADVNADQSDWKKKIEKDE